MKDEIVFTGKYEEFYNQHKEILTEFVNLISTQVFIITLEELKQSVQNFNSKQLLNIIQQAQKIKNIELKEKFDIDFLNL